MTWNWLKNFIYQRIENKDSVIFFAINHAGTYLGFTQLYPMFSSVSVQRTWVLNDLYVSLDARRMGVGKMLMNKAEKFAIESGAKGISLETGVENINAQSLYESIGYHKDENIYYSLNLKDKM